ncbi:MAG: YlbF family regulator [Clostridia bacterium]|nr:YlbF family regulator [Clostridia bacterium]
MEYNEIIAHASEIGKSIKESDLMKAYEAAEAAYLADTELQNMIREYGVQQEALAQESAQSVPNAFLTETIEKRLQSLYDEITSRKSAADFFETQEKVRALLTEVNEAIMKEVTGEDPHAHDGCTHDCSTCGGCH